MIDLGVVNFHLTHKCNYNCMFCHSNFFASKEKSILSAQIWKIIIDLLEPYCKRINIAGGEPLIHKSLVGDIIVHTAESGLISTLITNGYYLDEAWINEYGNYLRAIGISCDSSIEKTQYALGRGNGEHVKNTVQKFAIIHDFNRKGGSILTKLNTVVTSMNYMEDMVAFVQSTSVDRWKVFQLLRIEGENTDNVGDLLISKLQFNQFCKKNQSIKECGVHFVCENQEELTDTYIMVDPEGRFFSNTGGKYKFSDPIHEIGVEEALRQIHFKQNNLLNLDRMFL